MRIVGQPVTRQIEIQSPPSRYRSADREIIELAAGLARVGPLQAHLLPDGLGVRLGFVMLGIRPDDEGVTAVAFVPVEYGTDVDEEDVVGCEGDPFV